MKWYFQKVIFERVINVEFPIVPTLVIEVYNHMLKRDCY